MEEKEDFERTILFFLSGKRILKRGRWGIRTKYWSNKGGIQSKYDFQTRTEVQKQAAIELHERYPDLTRIHVRKNGIYDIRFTKNATIKT